jgi:crotonobetainyl-CoA:carnitine CoA-transferase CaiB-like acyl-CoA transferase
VPSQLFRSADGWVFIMAQLPKFWTALVERIGRPELAEDARFRTPADRLANRAALVAALDEVFVQRGTAYWVERLGGHVPVAPVHTLDQALDGDFLRQSGMVDRIADTAGRELRVLSNPIRLDGQWLANRGAPRLGEHSDAVLAEAGLDAAAIRKLREQGVV